MMGYELRRALREALGSEITGLQRAVALEIADDANDDTRLSYVTLEKLAQWTAAKDVNVVRNALKRLAAAGLEFRVPLGKGQDGRVLFAVPGKRLTFRVPEIEGVAAATPLEGGAGATSAQGVTTATPIGRTVATPSSPQGVAVAPTEGATAPTEGAGATPFSSISSISSSSDAAEPRGAPKESKSSKHAVADELAKAFFEHDRAKLTQSFLAIRGVVRTAVANGHDRDALARALHKLANEGRPISGGTLAVALGQVQGAAPAAITGPSEATRGPEARPIAETLAQRPNGDSIKRAADSPLFQQMRAQLGHRPKPVQPAIDDADQDVDADPDELQSF
jgi:hypothetical protein